MRISMSRRHTISHRAETRADFQACIPKQPQDLFEQASRLQNSMIWIEEKNIKVGVRGQLATSVAAQRDQGAYLWRFIGRVIKVAQQDCSLIGALHHQVENRTAG